MTTTTTESSAKRLPLLFRPGWRIVLWGLVIGLVWAGFAFDDVTKAWLSAAPDWLPKWGAVFSKYGDWPWLMLAAIPFLIYGWLRRRKACFRMVVAMMLASTLAGMAVNCVRLTSGRTRPVAEAEQGWYGFRHDGKWLVGNNRFNSFPSGHTATAVGFAVPLLLGKPLLGIPLMAMALGVAVARMAIGAHHFSDVFAATLVALVVGALVWQVWFRRERWLRKLYAAPRFRHWLQTHGGRRVGLWTA